MGSGQHCTPSLDMMGRATATEHRPKPDMSFMLAILSCLLWLGSVIRSFLFFGRQSYATIFLVLNAPLLLCCYLSVFRKRTCPLWVFWSLSGSRSAQSLALREAFVLMQLYNHLHIVLYRLKNSCNLIFRCIFGFATEIHIFVYNIKYASK